MHITDVRCILTAPAGIGLAVVKVETSEPGLYGIGCATFTQRLLAVRSAVEDYLLHGVQGRGDGLPQCSGGGSEAQVTKGTVRTS